MSIGTLDIMNTDSNTCTGNAGTIPRFLSFAA
jgi:hypothetical protein